jgi:hypothetical protein
MIDRASHEDVMAWLEETRRIASEGGFGRDLVIAETLMVALADLKVLKAALATVGANQTHIRVVVDTLKMEGVLDGQA